MIDITIISKTFLLLTSFVKIKSTRLKTTGEIIREQREKKEMLLRQLAARLDIDAAILSKIERGDRRATREQIIKLAEILELDKDELLIQYLGERIAYDLADEDNFKQALKVAEKRVNYIKQKRNDQT